MPVHAVVARFTWSAMATPKLLAHVLISKYCDHVPLYRQSQIFARHGLEIERSTLANWVGGACWWLESLQERLAAHVLLKNAFVAASPRSVEPFAYLVDVLQSGRQSGPL
jgi:transposase